MLHTEKGFCVLLTLLPGDSLGFDFGKPESTNQLFVVAPAHQSAVGLCPVWAGCCCVFFIIPFHPSVSLQGAGMALRTALFQCASMHVYIHEHVHVHEL